MQGKRRQEGDAGKLELRHALGCLPGASLERIEWRVGSSGSSSGSSSSTSGMLEGG